MEDFNKPNGHTSPIGWIRWLYLIVGCFIICLLIWMFSMISKDQAEYNNPEISITPTEQFTD